MTQSGGGQHSPSPTTSKVNRILLTLRLKDTMNTPSTFNQFCAEAYALLAYSLLNVPTNDTRDSLMRLSESCLDHDLLFKIDQMNPAEIEQAFYNRTVISCTKTFVPLYEQAIRSARKNTKGSQEYFLTNSNYTRAVESYYRQAGFDFSYLKGDIALTKTLRPDSLATELSFMSFLSLKIQETQNVYEQEKFYTLACAFLQTHLSTWVNKAADICESIQKDYFSQVVRLCALFIKSEIEHLSRDKVPV